MARPVNADAEATRKRLLDEAVVLFADRGLAGTSVRDIASAAGVSVAMVHHCFGNKDDLYEACIDAAFAELSAMKDELVVELDAGTPVRELLAHAVSTGFRFAVAHRTAVRLLLRAAVTTGEVHPRGRGLLLRVLEIVGESVGARIGRPASELRLPIQSLVFLVARYAAQADGERASVVGVSAWGKGMALDAVEEHLVEVAQGLLLGISRRSAGGTIQ
jgi:AcrR family transcriptional regulator